MNQKKKITVLEENEDTTTESKEENEVININNIMSIIMNDMINTIIRNKK